MKVRVHVFVLGRVQGVFFRSETRERARQRNVTGWVRNLPDGRVEATFEGERESVEDMMGFCRRGPRGAQVTEVEASFEEYCGEFSDFRIVW